MRLLIAVHWPPSGSRARLTRCTAVARAAAAAGHEVAFCAAECVASDLSRQGWRAFALPAAAVYGLPGWASPHVAQRWPGLSSPVGRGNSVGSAWMQMVASGMARPAYLRRLVQAQLQAVQEFQPDRIFTDGDPGAGLTAAIAGVSFAATYANVLGVGKGSLPWWLMRWAMNSVLRHHGQAPGTPEELCAGAHVLKIIPAVPELDGTDPERADVRYVGHLLEDPPQEGSPPADLESGRRWVLCHLGGGVLGIERLREVLPLVFPAGGDTDCLVGVPGTSRTERVGGVHFLPHVPEEPGPPGCEWTICDGDLDTVVRSLRRDVPLLVFPGRALERRRNARMVRRAGAGLLGEADDFTADWFSAALAQQIERAAGAAALGASIRSYGGPAAAVAAIEAWA